MSTRRRTRRNRGHSRGTQDSVLTSETEAFQQAGRENPSERTMASQSFGRPASGQFSMFRGPVVSIIEARADSTSSGSEQGDAATDSEPTEADETKDDDSAFSVATDLTDVVLGVEGKELHVNRAVLAHYSPVFSRMFFGEFKEKEQTKIELPGKSYRHFKTFLKVMYPQSLTMEDCISDENLVDILELAEEYQVDHVKVRCQDYIGEQLAGFFTDHYAASCTAKSGKSSKSPGIGASVQQGGIIYGSAPVPASSSFILSKAFDTFSPTDALISQMMLYFWMCDQHGLSKHRANTLSIVAENASDLDSMGRSPYYDSLPEATKISLLETLCRKLDGSCQRTTSFSFPLVKRVASASKQNALKPRVQIINNIRGGAIEESP